MLLCNFYALSQGNKDFTSWNAFNCEYKISKDFNLLFTEGIRFRENLTRLNQFLTEVGVEYKIKKKIKTSLTLRTVQKLEPENYFSFRHRMAWDINLKKKVNKFTFQYRHRLQSEIKNYYSSAKGKLPSLFERHKFQLKYEIDKRFEPFVSVETQYQWKDPRNMFYNMDFHRVRFQFGCDYNFGANSSLSAYYVIQNEFNIPNQQNNFILGIEYSIKF
jgi:hypothetical protein